MWGKIIIPMYRLWLHGLYGLYVPRCPLSPKRLINLISLLSLLSSLSSSIPLPPPSPHLFEFGVMYCMLALFMCHHELLPTVSHSFSFLCSSWSLAEGKHYLKTIILICKLVLQNFVISSKFGYSRLLSLYYFLSLSFVVTFFWLVCHCSLWLYLNPGN